MGETISSLIERVAGVCSRMRLQYYVTGGAAAIYYGRSRITEDVDVVVELPSWKVGEFCAAFPAPDFYVDEESARNAVLNGWQFNIIHPESGLKIDVMMPKDTGYDESRLGRARALPVTAGSTALFSSPEDVILMKLVWHREGGSHKHVDDIAAILAASGAEIDRAYIEQWAPRIGVSALWRQVLAEIEKRRE